MLTRPVNSKLCPPEINDVLEPIKMRLEIIFVELAVVCRVWFPPLLKKFRVPVPQVPVSSSIKVPVWNRNVLL